MANKRHCRELQIITSMSRCRRVSTVQVSELPQLSRFVRNQKALRVATSQQAPTVLLFYGLAANSQATYLTAELSKSLLDSLSSPLIRRTMSVPEDNADTDSSSSSQTSEEPAHFSFDITGQEQHANSGFVPQEQEQDPFGSARDSAEPEWPESSRPVVVSLS